MVCNLSGDKEKTLENVIDELEELRVTVFELGNIVTLLFALILCIIIALLFSL